MSDIPAQSEQEQLRVSPEVRGVGESQLRTINSALHILGANPAVREALDTFTNHSAPAPNNQIAPVITREEEAGVIDTNYSAQGDIDAIRRHVDEQYRLAA